MKAYCFTFLMFQTSLFHYHFLDWFIFPKTLGSLSEEALQNLDPTISWYELSKLIGRILSILGNTRFQRGHISSVVDKAQREILGHVSFDFHSHLGHGRSNLFSILSVFTKLPVLTENNYVSHKGNRLITEKATRI